ncbi:MAG: PTS sugar transporter subunit IIA, partial [Spirochaetales bacterium]|nr:PTS sugar transporter subunit IIA [Spirochaetales bacterium]
MPIGDYLAHNAAVFLNAASKKEAFQELAEFFTSQTGAAPGARALYGKMLEREESIPTWISRGIAIPHVIMPGFAPARLCIG